jgi:circadian clock protein KaiB
MSRFVFTLYIAGDTPRSQDAITQLRRLCDLLGGAKLDVVDVVADPERAERDRILTTPTVVKVSPEPTRRITGDLSDHRRVLAGLALMHELRDPYLERRQT